MARTFHIIAEVVLEDHEIPVENDWKAWGKIAQDELTFGEVYDVIEQED